MTHSLALLTPDLTAEERQLVLAAVRGDMIDLAGQPIRGAVIRDLVCGARPGWAVPSGGIRICRARVLGGIDLERVSFEQPLFFSQVEIEADQWGTAVCLADARFGRVSLHKSTLHGALSADRAAFAGGLFLTGASIFGVVTLHDGSLAGPLACEGAQIGDGNAAIAASSLEVGGPLVLSRAAFTGTVSFARGRIRGDLLADDASLGTGQGDRPALELGSAEIGGDLVLTRAHASGGIGAAGAVISGSISAEGLETSGAAGVSLAGSRIAQGIVFDRCHLEGPLELSSAKCARTVSVRHAEIHGGRVSVGARSVAVEGDFNFEGSKLVGVFDLTAADVEGNVTLSAARMFGSGIAFEASSARVRLGIDLDRAVMIGEARLCDTQVGSTLSLRGTSLKVERGAALDATGISIGRDAFFDNGMRAIGALVCDRAMIAGRISFASSRIVASGLAGHGSENALRDRNDKTGTVAASAPAYNEHAISLADAVVGAIEMPDKAEYRPRGIVDFSRASADVFEDYAAAWPLPVDARQDVAAYHDTDHLRLAGFSYRHLANPSGDPRDAGRQAAKRGRRMPVGRRRSSWLEAQSRRDVVQHLEPAPWRQLAERLDAQGFGDDARLINVARRRLETASSATTRVAKLRGRSFDLLAGYGYYPWRTVVWALVSIAAFAGLYAWADHSCTGQACPSGGAFLPNQAATSNAVSSDADRPHEIASFNPYLYSVDAFLPWISLGEIERWRINPAWKNAVMTGDTAAVSQQVGKIATRSPTTQQASAKAAFLSAARMLESILGGLLSVLILAGFTGHLRDDR